MSRIPKMIDHVHNQLEMDGRVLIKTKWFWNPDRAIMIICHYISHGNMHKCGFVGDNYDVLRIEKYDYEWFEKAIAKEVEKEGSQEEGE